MTVNHISKRFGDSQILDSVSFNINPGDRIGLVGPNGAGKSTLLRILAGDDRPDSGSLSIAPQIHIGHLLQGFADTPDGDLGDLLNGATHGLIDAHRALDIALAMYRDPATGSDAAAAHSSSTVAFDAAGGYATLDKLTALLDRFGLREIAMDTPLRQLSGGQKTRAGLAALLASRPDLLLLDEPTNHLDIDALDWLEQFLLAYPGAIVIVSHDRGFLDTVVTRILEIDPNTRSVAPFAGTFSDYASARRHRETEQASAYTRQQKEIARIQHDIRGMEHHARTIEANTIDFAVRKKAAKIARPAVVRKRKLERLLESSELVEKPALKWGLSVEFEGASHGARDVLVLDDATLGYDGAPILTNVSLHIRRGEKVAITGPNGGGKTTLIRTVLGELAPLAGSVHLGANVRAEHFAQEQDTLDQQLTVIEHGRAAGRGSEGEIRAFLHKFLFGDTMMHRQVGVLSYGERARLMLATLVLEGANLLLLDEPLNHLDIQAREEFEQALAQFDGTMLLVLHDRYTIERLTNRTIEVRNGRVAKIDLPLVSTA
ncbi:MAG: ABC-F family ATP-binding cassette domain-containing protein [Chloroflexia bacterium]|nr:ABC-F family ATP-binding cassette domain-containing protein [Chloroflexia bacterium]